MHLPDFLREAPYGEILLTGSRIGLYHVVFYRRRGMSPQQLHEQFPTLSPELLGKVAAFCDENRAEVEAYMARCDEDGVRQRKAAKPLDPEDLRRRARAGGVDVEELERRVQALDGPENG